MNDLDFILHLRSLGITFELDGDKVRFNAPRGVVTDELRGMMAERKHVIREFVQHGLANLSKAGPAARPVMPAITPAPRGAPLPLSYAQQRLWFLDQLHPGRPDYVMGDAVRFIGPLDTDIFAAALNEIVRRHESLRTVFRNVDGQAEAHVMPSVRVDVPVVNLGELGDADRETRARELCLAHIYEPFDLARLPLLRCHIVRFAPDDHVVAVAMHHIISDGWSVALFIDELIACYDALAQGREVPLDDLPVQYGDYAAWQRAVVEGGALDAALAYWERQLSDMPGAPELPTDQPRTGTDSAAGGRVELTLTPALTARLHALGRVHKATLFMTLMAAWTTLLHRYTRATDIAVGAPFANRHLVETERLLGLFLNTLVVRTRLTETMTFAELSEQVREHVLEAEVFRDVPFEHLVARLNPERDLGKNPFFDVMLNVVNVPAARPLALQGFRSEQFPLDRMFAKVGLTLYAYEQADRIRFELVYRQSLLSREYALCIIEQLEQLLGQVVEDPERPIQAYSLVTPGLGERLPDPRAPLSRPAYLPVPALLREQAERAPEHPAVRHGEDTLTHGALHEAITTVARALLSRGLGAHEVVAVTGPPSAGTIASMGAVLAARGVLLTIDPALPAERQQMMLEQAQARHVLRVVGGEIAAGDGLALDCDVCIEVDARNARVLAGAPASAMSETLPEPHPEDPAYIFFTSGTTGVPKAVLGWHGGLSHFIHWQRSTFAIGPDDRAAQLTALSFDVVLRDVFTPLCSGATLVIPSHEERIHPEKLLGWLERERISMLHAVPTLAQLWLQHAPDGVTLSALRRVFFAGEPLTFALVQRWRGQFPGAGRIVNLYGPTETTLAKCYFVVPEPPEPGVQPVGTALPHAQSLVINDAGTLCGVGELGEIAIRTPFRSLGYRNAPSETALRFVANPFAGPESGTDDLIYRTGDLGRYRPDGLLEIHGRVDHQVKIAGVRIEPDEVMAVLAGHASVRACVVVALRHPRGNYALVAYVVPADPDTFSYKELLAHATARLPAAMVPALLVPMDELPRTANGKIDRRRLPAPDWQEAAAQAASAAPSTPQQARLAAIWSRLLDVPEVGIHQSFFALGGHSLLAMRMIAEIRKSFAVDLPVRVLFEAPTIAELAARIAEHSGESGQDASELAADPDRRHEPFPLTDVQSAFWVGRSSQSPDMEVATQGYQELDLHDLDVGRLQAALNRLIRRHDMLRAVVLADGTQRILEKTPEYVIATLDLRGAPAHKRDSALIEIREQMAHTAMPCDRWPLFEIRVTYLEQDRALLHGRMDALVGDNWSAMLLSRELLWLYRHPDQELPRIDISFRDYVLAEHAARHSRDHDRARDYWIKRLPGLPPAPELPLAGASPAGRPRFARHQFVLAGDRWSALGARAKAAGITPASALLAAYAEILAHWSRTAHFTLNVTLFNRRPVHPQVNELVGNFSSLDLLEIDFRGPGPFAERARRVQKQLWDDLDHARFTGVQVMRELTRTGRASVEAVMPIVFTSTLGMPDTAVDDQKLPPAVYGVTQSAQVYLNHGVSQVAGGLLLRWDVLEQKFRPGVIEEMFAAYCGRVTELATDHGAWTEMRALPYGTAQRWLPQLAGEVPEADTCLHLLFERRAVDRPEHPAVITGTRELSYKELHGLAVAIGDAVRGAGAVPNQLVAVVMHKGWEQVAAVLGVHYAGAAYLPIDPALPAARIDYLLRNGRVAHVLTQSQVQERLSWPEHVTVIAVDCIRPGTPAPRPALQRPTDLAYVIYTSGSTGDPKGVMIDHRGAVNTILDINRRFSMSPGDRVLGVSSLSFDLSVYDVFGTLAAGATLVLPEAAARPDPEHWASCINRHQVTVWNSVPALMELLCEWVAQHDTGSLASLRLAMLSGDWIPVSLPGRVRALVRDIELISLGGATEASIWSILYPIAKVDPSWTSIPYGTSMRNQAVYVLDAHLEPRPLWVTGELYIGGIGVARGYWGDEEKTRARFIDHPDRGVLYRTGDMGRLMASGDIEFLGREDNQVKIRGYRIELGEIEAVASRYPQVRAAAVAVHRERDERTLVVYVVSDAPVDRDALRGHLAENLPTYMVPAHIVELERLPLTANGKVDMRRLPAPAREPAGTAASVAPRTPVETTLLAIWQQLLTAEAIGVHDNFFELGGDSILAIQMLTRAARAGLGFRARHVFEHPTIAGLAAVAGKLGDGPGEESASGEVLLTPVQRWFFEHDFAEPHHWNQAMLLDVVRPVHPDALRRAVAAIIEHHDALRTRFVAGAGIWRQLVEPWRSPVPFERVDLTGLGQVEARSRMHELMAERQAGASLADGPLIRVTLFVFGPETPDQLLLVIHHLVVDGISWRILLEDLQLALEQLDAAGVDAHIQLPPRTTSFQRWARRLSEAAHSDEMAANAGYWLSLPWSKVSPIPVDHPGGQNTVASARTFETVLSPEDTDALLRLVPEAYNTRINDVLLTALARGFAAAGGSRALLVDLEGHGREPLFDDLDVSRTVGWFTAIVPVLLDLGPDRDPGRMLTTIKEQLRQMPHNGVPYGLLRYMRDPDDELAARLRALPRAQVSFDYLGRMDVIATRDAPFFAWSGASAGPTRSPRALRRDLIEVIAVMVGGQLRTSWTYSDQMHDPATIEDLAGRVQQALVELIAHCVQARRGPVTASDFSLVDLDAATLERLIGNSDDIEDILPVSPMQGEMLHHARARTRAGAYHVQLAFTLRGALDVDAFTRSWQAVVDHHPILRTGFAWARPERPVQLVHRRGSVEVQFLSWRDVPEAERPERLSHCLQQDRVRGFELATPPLMRVSVLELGRDSWRVHWSHHHLLLDGWCEPLVLRDVLAAYTALCAGTAPVLEAAAPYRDYIAWLVRQPPEPVRAFWQGKLTGNPVPAPRLEAGDTGPAHGECAADVDRSATEALQSFARQHGLTLNVVVQGALAMCLRELDQADDILFGMTVSGRPPELRGVESMVGLFVNSLPVRARFVAGTRVVDWLHALQSELADTQGYQHTPPGVIRDILGAPEREPIINLRFQNYPMDVSLQGASLTLDSGSHRLRPGDVTFVDPWHYPINLVVIPGTELQLRLDYDGAHVADARARKLLQRLHHTLCHAPEAWRDMVL